MRNKIYIFVAALVAATPAISAHSTDQPVVIMQENLWIAFYDVPSRRFRNIRNAFVRRQFDQAAIDLDISADYLTIEADRAMPAIAERLNDVADSMTWISENTGDVSVTTTDLDALFSRAHWLLAQHYLDMAKRSRDRRQNRNAGLYLMATTHHLERAVLWSNSRINRDVHKTLENLRDLSHQLQDKNLADSAYGEKPMARTEKLLRKLGKTIDRPIVLPAG